MSQFFEQMREKKLRVTRAMLRQKALEIYENSQQKKQAAKDQFVASEGWMTKFLHRNGLVLRRTTSN